MIRSRNLELRLVEVTGCHCCLALAGRPAKLGSILSGHTDAPRRPRPRRTVAARSEPNGSAGGVELQGHVGGRNILQGHRPALGAGGCPPFGIPAGVAIGPAKDFISETPKNAGLVLPTPFDTSP